MPDTPTEPTSKDIAKLKVLTAGLKQKYPMLKKAGLITGDEKSINWEALAKDLIEHKKWNGQEIDKPPFPEPVRDMLNASLTQVDAISQHIADVEEEQKKKASVGDASWGQIGKAFLHSPLAFLGAIFEGLMKGFQNLSNGGSFMDGFTSSLKPLVAPVVAGDVVKSLQARLANDPKALGRTDGNKGPLTDAEKNDIILISGNVGNEVLTLGGVDKPLGFKLIPVKPGSEDTYRDQMHKAALAGFGLTSSYTRIENPSDEIKQAQARLSMLQIGTLGQFNDTTEQGRKQLAALTNTLADTMNEAASASKTPAEVQELVAKKLNEKADNMGFKTPILPGSKDAKILTLMADQSTIKYLESRPEDMKLDSTKEFITNLKKSNDDLEKNLREEVAKPFVKILDSIKPDLSAANKKLTEVTQGAGKSLGEALKGLEKRFTVGMIDVALPKQINKQLNAPENKKSLAMMANRELTQPEIDAVGKAATTAIMAQRKTKHEEMFQYGTTPYDLLSYEIGKEIKKTGLFGETETRILSNRLATEYIQNPMIGISERAGEPPADLARQEQDFIVGKTKGEVRQKTIGNIEAKIATGLATKQNDNAFNGALIGAATTLSVSGAKIGADIGRNETNRPAGVKDGQIPNNFQIDRMGDIVGEAFAEVIADPKSTQITNQEDMAKAVQIQVATKMVANMTKLSTPFELTPDGKGVVGYANPPANGKPYVVKGADVAEMAQKAYQQISADPEAYNQLKSAIEAYHGPAKPAPAQKQASNIGISGGSSIDAVAVLPIPAANLGTGTDRTVTSL